MDDDDWFTAIFGEYGWIFAPVSVMVIVLIFELIYHANTGGWWMPS
jgi:hypothetical protein